MADDRIGSRALPTMGGLLPERNTLSRMRNATRGFPPCTRHNCLIRRVLRA
jgi:hypothetical protein